MPGGRPTILASDQMRSLFVLYEHPALDASTAAATLVDAAAGEWGLTIDRALLPNPVRLWYKETAGVLAPCRADDPAASSQWWVFSAVPEAALTRAQPAA